MDLRAAFRSRSPSDPESRATIWPGSLLAHVVILVGLALVVAAVLAGVVWWGLGQPDVTAPLPAPATPGPTLSGGTPPAGGRTLSAAERLDSVKLILAVIAGVGGIVALAVAYRRQRYSEDSAGRERTRAFTDRLVKAVEQLGHERAAVRVAGIYAVAHLADDWEDGRQMCIDVLCAYLRMPYDPQDAAVTGEREVRRTLFRIIRNHLRTAPEWSRVKWSTYRFSFEGAVIDVCDLSGVVLEGPGHMTFHGVRFVDYFSLRGMELRASPKAGPARMWFTQTVFAGRRAEFDKADLTGGTVDLRRATFRSGTVSFDQVRFVPGSVTFGTGARHLGGEVKWGTLPPLPAPPRWRTRWTRRPTGAR